MKVKTKEILEIFQSIDNVEGRMEVLKNAYAGETLYVIAAGPSLNNYSPNQLKNVLQDKLVMCVKQPYHLLKDLSDFLLVNFTNLSPYDWKEHTITAWTFWFEQHPEVVFKNGWKGDLLFPVFRNANIEDKLSQSVAAKGDFENLMFDKTLPRPWGPGLVYELAIPLAVHMGVKEIVTIGWDVGDINMWNDSSNEDERHFVEHFYSSETQMYDRFTMEAKEIKLITDSILPIYQYLQSIGIDFKIISDRNPAPVQVPRINLEDIK